MPRIGGGMKIKATGQGSGQVASGTSGGIVVGQGLGKSGGSQAGAFESNKPVKIKSGMVGTNATVEPDKDKQSLSLLV